MTRTEAREKALEKHRVYHHIISRIYDAAGKGEFRICLVNEDGIFDCFYQSETPTNLYLAILNKFETDGYHVRWDPTNKFLTVGWW